MAGYSGTPLAKKLGYRPGWRVHLRNAPDGHRAALGTLVDDVRFLKRPGRDMDLIHVFVDSRRACRSAIESMRRSIRSDGMIWISWPKKSSGVATDMSEDAVREYALPLGLVDVKVCAVDDTWSALKLVVRKELR